MPGTYLLVIACVWRVVFRYGLSHLYFQQEKWVLAEVNIKRALSLNACSSMAYTQLAMIQQKQGHHSTALCTIEKALKCNSSNYLPKYHRALILESLEQYDVSYYFFVNV